jgi:hypothetical protein
MLETPRTSGRRNLSIALIAAAAVVAAVCYSIRISTAFDLPAHPLFLHAPVILVPEAVLVAIVLAVHRGWRERFGLLAGALVIIAMAATALAVGSGKELKDSMGGGPQGLSRHEDLGTTTLWLVIALTFVFLLLLLVDQQIEWSAISVALSAVVVVLAVLSAIWLIRAGDAGARLVWENSGG